MRLKDGSIAFFFIIKENTNPEVNGPSSIGMAVSKDGKNFAAKRCNCNFEGGLFATNDNSFLAAYCAGSKEDNYCLNRLRITKFRKDSF